MEDEKIYLKARMFNEWIDNMGQKITEVKDNLVLLETEVRQLSGIWESGAKEKWESELLKILAQARESVARMEVLTGKAAEKAQALAQMEKIMLQAIEGI